MTVSVNALRLGRLVDEDPALRMFRSDNAPVALAILAQHLGKESRRLSNDEAHGQAEGNLKNARLGRIKSDVRPFPSSDLRSAA